MASWRATYAAAPVSYTHLDVYKRQGLRREAATVGGAAVVIATHDPEVAAVADEEWHLDAGRASLVRGNLF